MPLCALRTALALTLGFVALCACERARDGTHPSEDRGTDRENATHRDEARVYAAASLTDALREIAPLFESLRGRRVAAIHAGSNLLALQLREGARPGVFISADAVWVDRLAEWGLTEDGSRVELLGNALVVVVPRDADILPSTLEDLAGAGFPRIASADPAVPAGRYAAEALARAGVLDALRPRRVGASDVRTALTYVERGEASAGIVYATDAAVSAAVTVAFRLPDRLQPRIVYTMVLVKDADRAARELFAFLQTPEAFAVFERAGFTRPVR